MLTICFQKLSDISPYLLRTGCFIQFIPKLKKILLYGSFKINRYCIHVTSFISLHSYLASFSSSNITKGFIKDKLALSNFLLPVLQLLPQEGLLYKKQPHRDCITQGKQWREIERAANARSRRSWRLSTS